MCVCCQVVVAALKFFLGSDSDENDESDSDSETEVIKITAKWILNFFYLFIYLLSMGSASVLWRCF